MTDGKICTDPAGGRALRQLTARLAPELPAAARDRIMVARIGMVNAFTTPGGYIIIGKELVDFARSPDEVAAVLAHEMGHAELEHPEAALVRTAGISLVIHMIFGGGTLGDVSGLLVQLSFSRQAERQADAIAIRRMRRAGADPAALATFFERLEGKYGRGKANDLLNLLQTHPPTAERIRRMRRARLPRASAILDAGDWRALRHICDRTAPLAFADE